jgi:hypothetical protein
LGTSLFTLLLPCSGVVCRPNHVLKAAIAAGDGRRWQKKSRPDTGIAEGLRVNVTNDNSAVAHIAD